MNCVQDTVGYRWARTPAKPRAPHSSPPLVRPRPGGRPPLATVGAARSTRRIDTSMQRAAGCAPSRGHRGAHARVHPVREARGCQWRAPVLQARRVGSGACAGESAGTARAGRAAPPRPPHRHARSHAWEEEDVPWRTIAGARRGRRVGTPSARTTRARGRGAAVSTGTDGSGGAWRWACQWLGTAERRQPPAAAPWGDPAGGARGGGREGAPPRHRRHRRPEVEARWAERHQTMSSPRATVRPELGAARIPARRGGA